MYLASQLADSPFRSQHEMYESECYVDEDDLAACLYRYKPTHNSRKLVFMQTLKGAKTIVNIIKCNRARKHRETRLSRPPSCVIFKQMLSGESHQERMGGPIETVPSHLSY